MRKFILATIFLLSLLMAQIELVGDLLREDVSFRFIKLNAIVFILLFSTLNIATVLPVNKILMIVFGILIYVFSSIPYILITMPVPTLLPLLFTGTLISLAFFLTMILPIIYFSLICFKRVKGESKLKIGTSNDAYILFIAFSVLNVMFLLYKSFF